jgi:polysaccharide export outer membrane protein
MTLRSRIHGRVRLAALAAACALVPACAPPPSPPPPVEGPMDRQEYVIGPADRLRIQVWKNQELSAEVPVRPDGKISVPLLNDVQAAGLTATELREVIATALAEYVSAPDVTVIVTEVRSKLVSVVGEVIRPSLVPLAQDMHVLDAIAEAGGFSAYADKDDIKILRQAEDGSMVRYRFDYPAFLKGKHPESNLRLQPGDTIVVSD